MRARTSLSSCTSSSSEIRTSNPPGPRSTTARISPAMESCTPLLSTRTLHYRTGAHLGLQEDKQLIILARLGQENCFLKTSNTLRPSYRCITRERVTFEFFTPLSSTKTRLVSALFGGTRPSARHQRSTVPSINEVTVRALRTIAILAGGVGDHLLERRCGCQLRFKQRCGPTNTDPTQFSNSREHTARCVPLGEISEID